MNKMQEFITIINSKLGCGYVYGGQNDQPLTREDLASLTKRFGRSKYYFNNYSAEKWIGKEYYDCSGLIVYALRKIKLIKDNADYSSKSIYSKLCETLDIKQLKAGDLCFNNTKTGIVHVGVYMGNNTITHARGTFYGVVNTMLFSSFNTFGRLKLFADKYPEVKVNFEKSLKQVVTAAEVLVYPFEISASIGKLDVDSIVNVEGEIDDSWYLVNIAGKKGYVASEVLRDYEVI